MKKDQKNSLGNTLIGLAIVLAVIVAANIALGKLRMRADLTEAKLYTLSDGTKKMLGDLERPITLKYYFSRTNARLPAPLKQYGSRIDDLLREYATHSNGKLNLESFDPKPDSDEAEWADRYGLQGQSLGGFGAVPDFYMGIAAIAGRKEATIPFVAPAMEPQLEFMVTRLITEIAQERKPKIGVMSSLPVLAPPSSPFQQQQQGPESWLILQELQKMYEVALVDIAASEIDADINALIVIHPKAVSPQTLYALDQFVLRGGRLMAFVDPLCLAEQQSGGGQPGALYGAASDLNQLTKAWGVELEQGQVVADYGSSTTANFGQGEENIPTLLTLQGPLINREEIVTSSLNSTLLPFPGAITGDAVEGLTMSALLTSSEEGAYITNFEALNSGSSRTQNAQPKGVVNLAVRLHGKFKTAFPDGAPAAAPAPGEPAPEVPEEEAAPGLTESTTETVVVLVADADILFDSFVAQKVNVFGQQLIQPMNDNLALLMNMTEQLSGSEALIGLRSRGTIDRPFHRVVELERKAQKQFQAEELALTSKLQEAQTRLNQLQQAKSDDQKMILSPAQKKEIETFKKQRFETEQQLREVRKNLRGEIESLGTRLKVLNIAGMPLVVALFGVGHWLRRRKRAKAQN